jgi:hypothetical protein
MNLGGKGKRIGGLNQTYIWTLGGVPPVVAVIFSGFFQPGSLGILFDHSAESKLDFIFSNNKSNVYADRKYQGSNGKHLSNH